MTESSNPGGLEDLVVVEHTADPGGPPAPDANLTVVDRLLLLRMGQAEFSMRVARIADSDWSHPTPCPDWTVADLLRHMIDEHRWAPPLLAGDDVDTARGNVAEVGADEDLITAWLEASTASSDAFGVDGALDANVNLTRGSTPATDYIAEMTSDLAVHGWDLGRAIGDNAQLPDSLAGPTWEWFREHGAELGDSGMFGVPVVVDADASYTDRLVGLAGRDRYWSPPPPSG